VQRLRDKRFVFHAVVNAGTGFCSALLMMGQKQILLASHRFAFSFYGDLTQSSALFISPDTAPLHLAAGLGIATIGSIGVRVPAPGLHWSKLTYLFREALPLQRTVFIKPNMHLLASGDLWRSGLGKNCPAT
jgi:ADP-heptose:LPS heptosyltransferase